MKYSQRIQELPPDERPYEKCLHSGPEKLTDSELLAVVLRSGTREAPLYNWPMRFCILDKTNRVCLESIIFPWKI